MKIWYMELITKLHLDGEGQRGQVISEMTIDELQMTIHDARYMLSAIYNTILIMIICFYYRYCNVSFRDGSIPFDHYLDLNVDIALLPYYKR